MADNRFARKQAVLDMMRRIPAGVRAPAREGVDEGAAFLVERIRPNVPREHGELADSLEWHRNPRMDKISSIVTEGKGQDGDPDNRKARAIENGRPDMAAQPHFFPTYRANKRRLRSMVMTRVLGYLRRAWVKA